MTYTEAAEILRTMRDYKDAPTALRQQEALTIAVDVLLHGTAKEQQCETCGRPLELTAITCPCGSHDLRPVHEKVTK